MVRYTTDSGELPEDVLGAGAVSGDIPGTDRHTAAADGNAVKLSGAHWRMTSAPLPELGVTIYFYF